MNALYSFIEWMALESAIWLNRGAIVLSNGTIRALKVEQWAIDKQGKEEEPCAE